jgi:hypothetical protein
MMTVIIFSLFIQTMQSLTELKNGLRLAIRPPYSPDLAPPHFFLLGHVKYCLQGMAFSSPEELLAAIGEIVAAISIESVHGPFEHWMKRLEWASQNNGD